MIKKRFWLTVLFFLVINVCNSQTSSQSLVERMDDLIQYQLPTGTNVGILAYDLTSEKVVYEYQSDLLCRPASTMKLLTAISTLFLTPYDAPFKTEVWGVGEIKKDVLYGDLYVVGGYDPEFNEESMEGLVERIEATGIREIQGRLVGDVSMKDSLFWGSGWAWDDNPDYYQPYLSPLMYCKGTVTVKAIPDEQGQPALITTIPQSGYFTIDNQTFSKAPAAGRFRVQRNWLQDYQGLSGDGTANYIIVSGNVQHQTEGTINVYKSDDYFLCALQEKLAERGILICESSASFCYDVLPSDSSSLHLLATWETPLQVVLNNQLKESDNLNAEALLCRLGAFVSGHRHISVNEGLDAIRGIIKELGLNPASYKLADGSGLSGYNYLSPELEVAFLRYAYKDKERLSHLMEALPIGGIDGTLKNRMKKGTPSFKRVYAKTGSFTGIYCLAGYVTNNEGHDICFSIMNQNALTGGPTRVFQDKVCDILVTAGN